MNERGGQEDLKYIIEDGTCSYRYEILTICKKCMPVVFRSKHKPILSLGIRFLYENFEKDIFCSHTVINTTKSIQ